MLIDIIQKVTGKESPLKQLFEPRAIAVVGASRRPEAVGYAVLNNLITGGFKGKIYPVNPKADEILGLPCSASIAQIPGPIDMAVLMVHSKETALAVEACAQKGARAIVVISAGFREVGAEGKAIEDEVIAVAKRHGIVLLGPNCLGIMNTDTAFSLNASFSRTMPAVGNIAFISQSGALCTAVLDYAKGAKIGFSKFVSLGNKAALTEMDLLRYLKDDSKTGVILLYLEDLVDAHGFIELAREITGDHAHAKPIIVIKSGRSAQGAKAAQSHTGSLMGSDEVYDAIFAQAGVLRLDSIEEMFDLGVGFSQAGFLKGDKVAIITNAGGPGIMATDACARQGLSFAEFTPATVEALRKVLPATASCNNPVDVIGDARHDRYEEALRITAKDPGVDGMIVILTPQAMTDIEETARVIVRAKKEIKIPLFACFMGIVDVSPGVRILEASGIPHYRFPEGAARVMGAMNKYRNWLQRKRTGIKKFKFDDQTIRAILDKASAAGQTFLPIDASMSILKAAGFPVLPFAFAASAEEAGESAAKIGFPVALKLISPQVVHKFDFGAVALNLKTKDDVAQACAAMTQKFALKFPEGQVEGFFIQAMSTKGVEVILGMNRDPQLGPTVMFGLGGIYVEVLRDVTFRLAPLRERSAQMMIESIRGYKILKGVRGEKPSDIAAIEDCLGRLSQLSTDYNEIQEVDVNPLMVHETGHGASVLDSRIIIKPRKP